jgi:Uma2 family endonuclease
MEAQTSTTPDGRLVPPPVLPSGLPILYEDDEEGDLGESNPHVVTDEILHVCVKTHLPRRPEYQVFSNMNLYYQDPAAPEISPTPYVSPDNMVVKPTHPLPETVRSYQIGREGPAPVLIAEILSERSAQQQRDLAEKVILYAKLGVAEYILVDVTGTFLPRRLLLKRLQPDQTWRDEQDPDGGVTSRLGFRLVVEADGKLRVIDAATGRHYLRPEEAQAAFEEARAAAEQARAAARQAQEAAQQARAAFEAEAEARRQAEERARALEAELACLRGQGPEGPKS